MSGMRFFCRAAVAALAGLLAGACATADTGSGDDNPMIIDAPGTPPVDAPDTPPIDAPPLPIDAPPIQMITLTQSTSTAITALNTVACANNTTGYTDENSYYRVFRLTDHGVNTQFTATRVDFAIEEAAASSGSQTVQVRVHTLNGAFVRSNLTTIAGQTISVPNQSLGMMSVTLSPPGVAPAGSTVVLEIFAPNGTVAGNTFFPGSNAAAETGPSYIRAPAAGCDIIEPVTYASIGQSQVHLVMSLTGTY